MKHALVLIITVVLVYAGWMLADKPARRAATRQVTRHGLRLLALIVGVLLLLAGAYHLTASPIL